MTTACWDIRRCSSASSDRKRAGYRATKHQAFVGTGYFDAVQTAITAGEHSTGAMAGSTETEQFISPAPAPEPRRVVA